MGSSVQSCFEKEMYNRNKIKSKLDGRNSIKNRNDNNIMIKCDSTIQPSIKSEKLIK